MVLVLDGAWGVASASILSAVEEAGRDYGFSVFHGFGGGGGGMLGRQLCSCKTRLGVRHMSVVCNLHLSRRNCVHVFCLSPSCKGL